VEMDAMDMGDVETFVTAGMGVPRVEAHCRG
jgi:hypothetical protein